MPTQLTNADGVEVRMGAKGETLRVGVLGAGPIAQAAHFEACQKAHNVHLQAICDRAPDLLQQMACQYEPESIYSSYEELLEDPKVDAVLVAIADQFHIDAATAALKAGKHVFVESCSGSVPLSAKDWRASFTRRV